MTVKPHYSLSFQGVQQAKQSYTLYYEPSLGISSDILVKITKRYLKIHLYLNIIIHTLKTYSCKRIFYLQYNTQIKYPPITSTNKFNYLMIYSTYDNNFKHVFMLLLKVESLYFTLSLQNLILKLCKLIVMNESFVLKSMNLNSNSLK